MTKAPVVAAGASPCYKLMRVRSVTLSSATCRLCLVLLLPGAALAQSAPLAQKSAQAKALMESGKYAEAVPLYRDLVRTLPQNAGLAMDLGLALHMAGRQQAAVAELQRALRLDSRLAPADLYLGDAYLALGEPAKAIAPLRKFVAAMPGEVDARQMLAQALRATGDASGAAAEFEKLAKTDPERAEVWYGLGKSYAALSRQAFAELSKTAPGSAYWLALTAESRARALQYSGAFYLYRQALRKMPSLRGVHAALADIYRKTGRPDWAAIEEARERKLGSPNCATDKLACDYAAGRFQAVIAHPAGTPEALYWQSKAYNKLAVQAFARLAAFPASAEYHQLLAGIHSSEMDFPQAAAEWNKAYELSHHDPAIGRHLAMALMQVRNFREAQPLLEALARRQPRSAEVNYLLGYLWLSEQAPAEAIPRLQAALRLDPGLLPAQAALARADVETGQNQKAIPHLKAALPMDTDGSLHYLLARAYQATGQPRLAAQALRQYQRIHQAQEAERQAEKEQIKITPPGT
jgi:predicted Zn-dependent protease